MVSSVGSSILTSLGASSLDTASLVDQLAKASIADKQKALTARETANTAKISDLASAVSSINAFSSSLSTLISGGTLYTQPTSSNTNVLQVSAQAGARLNGLSASVRVEKLAMAQTMTAAPLTGASSPVGMGTLELKVGSQTKTITIDSTNNTLAGLAKAIKDSGLGVSASIVSDSSGARLVVKGATGAANAFSLKMTSGTAGELGRFAYDPATYDPDAITGLTLQQGAQNAELIVAGVAVSKATNSITDVIDGVKLDLMSASPGTTITIGSSQPVEAIKQALAGNAGDLNLWRILIVALIEAGAHEAALDAIERGRAVLGPQLTFTANEAAARSELGDVASADALFEIMAKVDDLSVAIRHVRHLLRTGRVEQALPLIERWARPQGPNRAMWPYAAIAWRLAGDARADWLDDPSFVRIIDLADRIDDLPALARRLRTLHRSSAPHLDQSVRGGTQTDGPLFSRVDPEVQALRALVVEAARDHLASLPAPDPRHPLLAYGRPSRPRFAGSWSVRLTGEGGGHHANHVHPAGLISSAFYVTVPREAATGTQAGWLTLGSPQAELGIELAPTRTIEPKPGRLVLFPSTMWHGTLPYNFGERMTVAFDIAPPLA